MKKTRFNLLFQTFTGSDKNAGLVLVACTVLSLIFTNSAFGENYSHFWHNKISVFNIGFNREQAINDGLMSLFFLVVGLEIKRELLTGELYPIQKATLPLFGAIGGMLVPALIFIAFNFNTSTVNGFGIPMGTDIAFALGILSLAGNRVPVIIKVILTAIAIIDDLGSILIIALFYGSGIHINFLFAALGMFLIVLVFNRLKIQPLFPYLLAGIAMWFFMLRSGIHPTISGVLLAFAIPLSTGEKKSPASKLQHLLHVPVSFIILPLFTLANTAILIKTEYLASLTAPHALGIGIGLIIGKPLGIMCAFFILIKTKLASMPTGILWRHFLALGCIAGIGFTMSVFITQLAFNGDILVQSSKLMILLASAVAGLIGFFLFYTARKTQA